MDARLAARYLCTRSAVRPGSAHGALWHSHVVAFTVLFVCTGNICRSPVAERLFRARVNGAVPLTAVSAGVAGLTGRPMDQASALALRRLGVDPGGHVGRRLSTELVSAADLILTAELTHRARLIQANPAAHARTFTLREFGRLGAGLPSRKPPLTEETLRSRVAEVADRRGDVDAAPAGGDDIADPLGASPEIVHACVAQIAAAVDEVIAVLGVGP